MTTTELDRTEFERSPGFEEEVHSRVLQLRQWARESVVAQRLVGEFE